MLQFRRLADLFETLVRTAPPAEVTTRNAAAEVPPASVGLDDAVVSEIWRAVEALYETGLHPAVALCLRRRGKVVIDRAIGHAAGNAPDDPRGAPKTPATPETLFCLFSASKAVTAMLVHLLDERRSIHLDDPVADYIPGFEANGKSWITIRHVLTHRAGVPTITGGRVDLELLADWERIIARLVAARPTWRPGRRLAYHALTGGWILGEIVRRVTGLDVRAFLRREVLDPLGFRSFGYGVPAAEHARVARNAFTGPPVLFPLSAVMRRALGVPFEEAVRTVVGTAVTVNSVLPGPTRSEGVGAFVEDLARARGCTAAEVEADFFGTARPTSLLKRFLTPEEIAAMIVYLASPLASGTTGAALRVDGGVVRAIG